MRHQRRRVKPFRRKTTYGTWSQGDTRAHSLPSPPPSTSLVSGLGTPGFSDMPAEKCPTSHLSHLLHLPPSAPPSQEDWLAGPGPAGTCGRTRCLSSSGGHAGQWPPSSWQRRLLTQLHGSPRLFPSRAHYLRPHTASLNDKSSCKRPGTRNATAPESHLPVTNKLLSQSCGRSSGWTASPARYQVGVQPWLGHLR